MTDTGERLNIFYVDITPTHGVANMDLAATLIDMMQAGMHCNLLALKSAIFRDALRDSSINVLSVHDIDWINMWVREEGINRSAPLRSLDGIYRKWFLSSYTKRVTEQVEDLLNDAVPDLVHANNFDVRLTPVVQAARRLRIPIVCSIRAFRKLSSAERQIAQEAALLLPISEGVRANFVEQFPRIGKRTVVWHNGIAFDRIPAAADREAIRREYGIAPDRRVVSIVGRVAPFRGTDLFVGAMIAALKDHPDAVGLVMGRVGYRERELANALQSRADRELGPGRILFVLDRKREEAFVAASDLMVHASVHTDPTRGMVEGISRDVLLAMGLGVPVVCTDAGPAGRLIEHERTGLLIPPGDMDAIEQAVRRLLDEPELAARLAGEARRTAYAEHNSAMRSRQLLDLYAAHVFA